MENPVETYKKSNDGINANNPSHYVLMTIGIVVTIIGTFLRFVADWTIVDIVSNVIFIVGVIICIKSVMNILK
jgi:hypothetical protein